MIDVVRCCYYHLLPNILDDPSFSHPRYFHLSANQIPTSLSSPYIVEIPLRKAVLFAFSPFHSAERVPPSQLPLTSFRTSIPFDLLWLILPSSAIIIHGRDRDDSYSPSPPPSSAPSQTLPFHSILLLYSVYPAAPDTKKIVLLEYTLSISSLSPELLSSQSLFLPSLLSSELLRHSHCPYHHRPLLN